MPTITIDPYMAIYQEIADCDFSWQEEGTNRYGFVSHSLRPGDGAQWDPTRNVQFAVFGFRCLMHAPSVPMRRINFSAEGPHESGGTLVFAPPVSGPVLHAYVHFGTMSLSINVDTFPVDQVWRYRVFGVAVDDFISMPLDTPTGYPMTYRGEFHQSLWGAPRRYRCDQLENEMPHTVACIHNTIDNAPVNLEAHTTLDLSSVVNEILSRPGWAPGNKMALCIRPEFVMATAPFAPDYYGGEMGGGSPWNGDDVTLTLEYD